MLARVFLICALAVSVMQTQSSGDQDRVEFARRTIKGLKTYTPPAGLGPDSDTAITIATAVLTPIYGRTTIDSQKPWNAGLKDGVWTIVGTFNGAGLGGEAFVQIDKRTGAIVFVGHTM
jgi:hypothetical protein